MTGPTDPDVTGVEGTEGKLYYWTRQGISLADFEARVAAAIALIEEHGGIAGVTPLGVELVTSLTPAEARDVIDAAEAGVDGTPVTSIPITEVDGLQQALDNKSVVGHHHSSSDIDGLSTDVRAILNAPSAGAVADIIGTGTGTVAEATAAATAAQAAAVAAQESAAAAQTAAAAAPVLVGGLMNWANMPSGSMALMDSPSGAMIARRTTRDDIVGIWRFPAAFPPAMGGGTNAHDGDEWWVEV